MATEWVSWVFFIPTSETKVALYLVSSLPTFKPFCVLESRTMNWVVSVRLEDELYWYRFLFGRWVDAQIWCSRVGCVAMVPTSIPPRSRFVGNRNGSDVVNLEIYSFNKDTRTLMIKSIRTWNAFQKIEMDAIRSLGWVTRICSNQPFGTVMMQFS